MPSSRRASDTPALFVLVLPVLLAVGVGCEGFVGIEDINMVEEPPPTTENATPTPATATTPPAPSSDAGGAPSTDAAAPPIDASGDVQLKCATNVTQPPTCASPGFKNKNDVCLGDCVCGDGLWCARPANEFSRCAVRGNCGAPCQDRFDCISLSCSLVTHQCE